MDRYQTVIAVAVLLIIGGAIGFLLGRAAERGVLPIGRGTAEEQIEEGSATSGAVVVGGNAIAVNDQPSGMTVTIAMVALAQDGWVVIHKERDGGPGNILGARRFNAGQGQSGSVELLVPAEEGKVHFVMLHADDGDRQFDHTKDLPIRDPQGNPIFMRFVATANPSGE